MIKTIDPVGRVISNVYAANGIDLLQVHQTTGTNNDLLATYIYNSQHLVITNIDASGQGTTYTYDPYGKVLTRIDPLGETTSYVYSNEYLIATIDATGTTNMTYTYDLLGRVWRYHRFAGLHGHHRLRQCEPADALLATLDRDVSATGV